MEGLGLTCPECGCESKSEQALHRTRRRWRRAALGLVLVLAGVGTALTPTLRSSGFAPLVPTSALILGMGRIDPAYLEKHLPPRARGGLWEWQERMLLRRATAALASGDPAQRRCAVRVMLEFAEKLRPDPAPFAALLTDPDTQVRDCANGILRLVVRPGEHDALIPAVYAAMLAETQYWTGLRFGHTLGHFGNAALPLLQQAASHTDPNVRERAMWGLGRLAVESDAAADALIAALSDTDPAVRYRAAHAVGPEITPAARARVIEALRAMSGDSNAQAAKLAAMRLQLLNDTAQTP